jgi:hypothetical protein
VRERAHRGGACLFIEKGTNIEVLVGHINELCGCEAS